MLKAGAKPSGVKVAHLSELGRGTMKEVKVGDTAVLLVHVRWGGRGGARD